MFYASFLTDIPEIWWIIKTFGPMTVLVIIFVARDCIRENKLTKRVEKLEDDFRDVILPLVEETASVIASNTEVLKQNTKVLERYVNV